MGASPSSLPGWMGRKGRQRKAQVLMPVHSNHLLPVTTMTMLLQGMKKEYLRPQQQPQAGMSWGLCKQHLQSTEEHRVTNSLLTANRVYGLS